MDFFTNLNSSPSSSIVNMYSSSNYELQYPIKSSIKLLINHYFLQRSILHQYHVSEYSEHDSNSAILALFSLYSTSVESRFIHPNLIHNIESVNNIVQLFTDSRTNKCLKDLPRSIFRDFTKRMITNQALEALTETELVYQKANEYSRRHQPRANVRIPSPVRPNKYGADDYVDLSDSDKSERRSIDLDDYTVTPLHCLHV